MEKYSLILLSGGVGSRINIGQPKQYALLHGIPMIIYSILAIKDIEDIDEIIVNYPEDGKKTLKRLLKSTGVNKKIKYISAGNTRQESVYKMLKKVTNKHLIIHEAARPIVNKKTFKALLEHKEKNCGYMSEIAFTVAPINPKSMEVTGSLDRDKLRNVLLPQKFETKSLTKAHKKAFKNNLSYTEDACLFVDTGRKFYFIDADSSNIKVTYRSDLLMAESLLDTHKNDEGFK
jgi:2-C-methyl-D-erythritol 4-phosphate cytidylyltransferase